jgi:ankyrin repeat protein
MSKALKDAIDRNDAAAAALAVKKVKDLSRKMPGASTPVLYACQKGADAVIDVLLDAGAPPKGVDGYAGNSPFVVAMEHGQVGVMRRLHARGVVTAEQLEHAMFLAVLKGFVEPLRFMLAELRQHPAANLIHQATRSVKLSPALIRLLAEHGADVNGRWDDADGGRGEGRRPIHTAAANGTPSAVRTLAQLGADVNARDDKGRTPIMSFLRNLGGQRAHNENLVRWARMKE